MYVYIVIIYIYIYIYIYYAHLAFVRFEHSVWRGSLMTTFLYIYNVRLIITIYPIKLKIKQNCLTK